MGLFKNAISNGDTLKVDVPQSTLFHILNFKFYDWNSMGVFNGIMRIYYNLNICHGWYIQFGFKNLLALGKIIII